VIDGATNKVSAFIRGLLPKKLLLKNNAKLWAVSKHQKI
jgi:hypothetical protein